MFELGKGNFGGGQGEEWRALVRRGRSSLGALFAGGWESVLGCGVAGQFFVAGEGRVTRRGDDWLGIEVCPHRQAVRQLLTKNGR